MKIEIPTTISHEYIVSLVKEFEGKYIVEEPVVKSDKVIITYHLKK